MHHITNTPTTNGWYQQMDLIHNLYSEYGAFSKPAPSNTRILEDLPLKLDSTREQKHIYLITAFKKDKHRLTHLHSHPAWEFAK